MAALNPPVCDFGWKVADFDLPATDGKRYTLDAVRGPAAPDARRELFEAMLEVARTGKGPRKQIPYIGCSIEWRE